MTNRPILGITMGDPFGNGAEISVKALSDKNLYERCRPLIVGDKACMEYALSVAKRVSNIDLTLHLVDKPDQGTYQCGTIDLIDLGIVQPSDMPSMQVPPKPFGVGACALGGEAAFRYVEKVIELAMDKQVDATVTNALSKEAINLAGHHYSGHTEIYADYTHTKKYAMLLAYQDLRVIHVSTHVSLREACDRVKKARVLECILMADETLRQLGMKAPKIAVAGLNPHCGEGGLFGQEEIKEIQPAIDEALQAGVLIPDRRPVPADTVFSKALGGWYDVVVVMYHDQGHIPLKTKGFVYNREKECWDAVAGINVTLGLPIIRTSVDHGTGIDFAGSGQASPISLINAVDYAIALAQNKTKKR